MPARKRKAPARSRRARSAPSSITLAFVDAYRQPLDDRVDVLVRSHQRNRTILAKKNLDGARTLAVSGLAPLEVCSVQVFPVRHRPVSHFIRAGATPLTLPCPVDPERVTRMVAPPYDPLAPRARAVLQASVLDHSPQNVGGQALYAALEDVPRAGFLNLVAKMNDTKLLDGSAVLDHVESLYRMRGDRVFANVAKGLRDLVKTAVDAKKFDPVDGSLHDPPEGYKL
ncbi:MAG TPA: hypothetical protein VMT87_01445, partial [Vicinamibacteria bacterium]|nr:hypothetical protein [Vicinamibacteria bacterium]